MHLKNIILILISNGLPRATSALSEVLFCAGLWFLFGKCGIQKWKALIPCYNYFALGECAGSAHDGKIVFVSRIATTVCYLVFEFAPHDSTIYSFANLCSIVLVFINIIYEIRIYIGLIAVFGRRKRWLFLWIPFNSLCALLWGLSKKYQPLWQVSDMRIDAEEYFSGSDISALEDGLTVNLKKRTVKTFLQKKDLLRDIHISVRPGKMVLLLGGSGAGKSTFVNAVNGYEKADAEIVLNGTNVYKEYDTMKYEVGYVPQLDLVRGNDTVLRTLMDASALRLPVDLDADERRRRVDYAMEVFSLLPVQNALVEKLSGGQRKRLSIAMEFISNPSLFILDEPDSGLDGVMARELMNQLRSIADQGKIVIVITHTPDRVIDLFDDVIVLAKDENRIGRLAYYGPVAEARKFFGKDEMEEILKLVNRTEDGGAGRADEFIRKYTEAHHG